MKKFIGILLAISLSLIVFYLNTLSSVSKVDENLVKLNYINNEKVMDNFALMKRVVAQNNNTLVFGSSDFNRYNEKTYPSDVFNFGNSDFNFTLIGKKESRSLTTLLSLASLEPYYNGHKLSVLINSSWFSKDGVTNTLAQDINEDYFREFLNNKKISKDLKDDVTDRIKQYLELNPQKLENIKKIYNECMGDVTNISDYGQAIKYDFNLFKFAKFELNDLIEDIPANSNKVVSSKIDTASLFQTAEKQGLENVSNNSFFISDKYFTKNISFRLKQLENSKKNDNFYPESPEFKDLELLMRLISELKKPASIHILPMNSKYYDFVGYGLLDRKRLYSKEIQTVKKVKNDNLKVIDYNLREDEPYFFKDTNNLGWKGWVYIIEDILEFNGKIKK